MYGNSNPLEGLSLFLVDDGVKNRGHRTNIFNKNFAHVGCYTGKWGKTSTMTVVDFTGSYKALNYVGPKVAIETKV